jgi:hypothetical protein
MPEDDSQESKHVAKIIIYVILKLTKYIIIFLCRRKYTVDLQHIEERDMIETVYLSSCKVPSILVRFQRNLNFPDIFTKILQISNLMKIRPVKSELLRAHRQACRS